MIIKESGISLPTNNLWKVFRQLVEKTELPRELTHLEEWIKLDEEEKNK